jgi:hypothetical protein
LIILDDDVVGRDRATLVQWCCGCPHESIAYGAVMGAGQFNADGDALHAGMQGGCN